MDKIVTLLSEHIHSPEMVRWGLMLMVGLGVFVFIVGAAYILSVAFSPAKMRLQRVVGGGTSADEPSVMSRIGERIEPLGSYLLPKKEWERTRIDAQLVHAGLRSPHSLTFFYTIKTILGVMFAAAVVFGAPVVNELLNKQYSLTQIAAATLFMSFIGMTLPNFILNRMVESRQLKIRKGFPDALDMMVVAMEAGMGLASAIQRVSKELSHSHAELADEMGLVNAEIRSGVDRGEALRNLARRTGVEDLAMFAGMIAQTLRYGTSIADTLRVFSEDMRDKRMQKAEEHAAKIGTKLIFPLVTCFFPAFFVVAVGPAAIKIIEVFNRL